MAATMKKLAQIAFSTAGMDQQDGMACEAGRQSFGCR
jgi:hypothetical protein